MKYTLPVFLLLVLMNSCMYSDMDTSLDTQVEEFIFSESFDFKNSKSVSVITSGSQGVIKVYLNDEDKTLLGTFANTGIEIAFEVPDVIDEVILIHIDGKETQSTIEKVQEDTKIQWNVSANSTINSSARSNSTSNESSCQDALYAVESSYGGFWAIDITNDSFNEFAFPNLLGGGSIACALDQENSLLYYNVKTTLYSFDLIDSTFSEVFNSNPFNGNYPRFTYRDGKFFMSNSNTLYIVDATTNEVLNKIAIEGFINSSGGGDIDFTSDGTLYLSCFSGLYKFIEIGETTAKIERISAENFPHKLTSMAIDREDRIFVGTNDNNSMLIEMNKEDGSFQIVKTYDHKINDLAAWRCAAEDLGEEDSDGDGVPNALDDHPDDPEVAFDLFTPSELGYGTLAFEDMWPAKGDYDFNDMVVNYKFITLLNTDNEAVRLIIKLKAVAAGASFSNGLGIELPISSSLVASVSGTELFENFIVTEGSGVESGHDKAVIIPFDNISALFGGGSLINTRRGVGYREPIEMTITVNFTEPIDGSLLNGAPYNPFVFTNKTRSKEIHLRNGLPTALADQTIFQTGEDRTDLSSGKSYVNEQNVPWGINMIHNFRYPVEKTRIDKAYNHFIKWGQSEGLQYKDWYKDNSGFRQDDKLVFIE